MAVGERAYTATEEQAMAIIRRWCDEGWTKGNVDVADEIIHPNFKVHGAGGQVVEPGIEGLKELIRRGGRAFPMLFSGSRTSTPSATRSPCD